MVLYWVQSNALFGNLARTDNRHTILALGQVFFLLLYLYAIGLGVDFPEDPHALALQSVLACLVGLAAATSWRYACHQRRLLSDRIQTQEARNLQLGFLAEPITALVTIPFAFARRIYWELAWRSYPFLGRLPGRWKKKVQVTGAPRPENPEAPDDRGIVCTANNRASVIDDAIQRLLVRDGMLWVRDGSRLALTHQQFALSAPDPGGPFLVR